MITRIVKLTIDPSQTESFIGLINQHREQIRSFEGCHGLELLRDTGRDEVFFTLSQWESEAHMEAYRQSDFFREVWAEVKETFRAPARAWSLRVIKAE